MEQSPLTPSQLPSNNSSPVMPQKKKDWLKIGLIFTSIIILASAIVILLLLIEPRKNDLSAEDRVSSLAEELTKSGTTTTPQLKKITSSLGFSFSFDPTLLSVHGQVTNAEKTTDDKVVFEEFSNDELDEARPYSIITIQSKDSGSEYFSSRLTLNTNIRKNFWEKFKDDPDYPDSKQDLLVKYLTQDKQDDKTTVSDAEEVEINNNKFLVIRLIHDNSSYGVTSTSETTIYATVQNDRPYWLTIYNSNANPTLIAEFEKIIAAMSFDAVDDNLLGSTGLGSATLASNAELPKDTANVPEELDKDSIYPVVLRNQPSVVRILTVRCGIPVLVGESKKIELPSNCSAGVGSGSFISSDGNIATNGHVVTIDNSSFLTSSLTTFDTVKIVLDFMLDQGKITNLQYSAFISDLRSNNPSAIQAVAQLPLVIGEENIKVEKDDYSYGVQTSNEPVRINDNDSIAYSDTVLKATLIDKNFDAVASAKALRGEGEFNSSDVAILKVNGEFPTVKLANGSSAKEGDRLTAIGFPGFVDNNIKTSQWQTVPTITQGEALSVYNGRQYGGRVIQTSAQIAPGNSGGPAFNEIGEQIGLVTYGAINCSDKNCFGDGMVRDISDIHDLVLRNNISLEQGAITTDWEKGIEAYSVGNYRLALEQFDKVKRAYPANYLAPELSRIARANIGSSTDSTDRLNIKTLAVIVTSVILFASTIIAIVLMVVLLKRKKELSRVRLADDSYQNTPSI